MTKGEWLVGIDFNPSNSGAVSDIKTAAATLINFIEEQDGDARCKALAITAIEEGAMWAVKAVTKPSKPEGVA